MKNQLKRIRKRKVKRIRKSNLMPSKKNKDKKKMELNKIDQIVKEIREQFDESILFSLKDKSAISIPVYSTGIMSIDSILGVNGVPKGRIVEIYGPESQGKCLTKDTYISNPNGLLTLEEIFNDNGVNPSCTSKIVEKKVILQNKEGNEESTTNFTCNNRRKVIKITTKKGWTQTGTYNQPILIINKYGFIEWKILSKIKNGDNICIQRKLLFGNKNYDADEMYMLGLLIADGYMNKDCGIEVTNDDPDIKNFIITKLPKLLGVNYKDYKNNDKGSINYHFNGKKIVDDFHKKYGYKRMKSCNKNVSKYIREGNKNSIAWFLAGYFDSESYAAIDNNAIEVSSASYELLFQIKLLLQGFGIISSLSKVKEKNYPDNDYWRLCIYGDEKMKFVENIPTLSEKVRKRYDIIKNKVKILKQNQDNLPNVNKLLRKMKDIGNTITANLISDCKNVELTYNKLNVLLENDYLRYTNPIFYNYLVYLHDMNYYYDSVEEIEYLKPVPTFDFAMEKSSSFIGNGIVTHNTTLALHIIAEIQKNGGLAAFIDAEHALDVNYARKIGVDIENLLIAQPDYGEQALDIVKVLVKTNKMAVIVVDSVSALVPKEELEATMEKASIALQARMMSKHLRQITSALGKNSITSLIFINQVRERVGIMFGNPEDTTGGRALKFYSTIRIDVRKRGQSRRIVKKGDSPEAIKCHIRVVKNKVAPPFQECDFEIIFGKGIDKIGDIITHAVKLNIIKKGDRGLYTYKEEKFHGENRMMKYFEKDEHFRKLKNRILKKLKGE